MFGKAVVALSLAGLTVGFQAYGAAAEDKLREEFHQTYSLSPGGRLALKNVNGAARIAVWDQNQVKIDAIKTAKDQETLSATQIVVDPKPDAIEIKTQSKDNNRLGSVEYTLTVPRHVKLDSISLVNGAIEISGVAGMVRARSVNGSITCSNLEGEVDLSTVNGSVNSSMGKLLPDQRVSLKTVNGKVEATIPAGASAKVAASTLHGKIDSDFGSTDSSRKVGERLDAVLGGGGTPVQLTSVNGGIRIRKQ